MQSARSPPQFIGDSIIFNARCVRQFDGCFRSLFSTSERILLMTVTRVGNSQQTKIEELKNSVTTSGFLRISEGDLRKVFMPYSSRLGCIVRKELETQVTQQGFVYSPKGVFEWGGNCKDRELLISVRNSATGKLMEAFAAPSAETDNSIRDMQACMDSSRVPHRLSARRFSRLRSSASVQPPIENG